MGILDRIKEVGRDVALSEALGGRWRTALAALGAASMYPDDEAEAAPKFPQNFVKSFDDVIHNIPVSIRAWHGSPFIERIRKEGFKLPDGGERNPLVPTIQGKFKLRNAEDAKGLLGRGVYSADSKSFAKTWGEPLEIDVNLKQPYVIDHASIDDLRRLDLDAIRKDGFDGIVVKKGRYGLNGESYRQGVAFDPLSVEVATTPFIPTKIVKGAKIVNPETGETGVVRGVRELQDHHKEFYRDRGEPDFNSFLEVRWNGKKGVSEPRTDGNVRDTSVTLKSILSGAGLMGAASLYSPEAAQARQVENSKAFLRKIASKEALEEPVFDPTTLLAGPAKWGGGVINAGIDALMRALFSSKDRD